ncbi:GntR family transcriptional regulator [Gorillibacterium timonense]|uniref:GntR family transcriptional regulator n=1 Tax=Gorillibacterium timonense TaxID=1689269 RepID=UPI001F3CA13E|nr:GntR family transcriptional regulator [Gorillibacterium timonense]
MNSANGTVISTSISQQIYDQIKQDILAGVYTPGDRLLVLELADRFKVSQAPVREALERLRYSELVISSPNKGSVVSDISAKEIREIFELRELLEVYAIRQALPKLTSSDYDHMERSVRLMEEAVEQEDILLILQADLDFHGYLYEHSGNQMALDIWDRMKLKMKRFMAISLKVDTIEFMVEEHLSLLELLKSGDVETAERRFVQHMQSYKLFDL